ncbi:SDR family NAD(P)-dependent oxidoreductase [Pseudonocardia sp. C8]|uniref:SDR family NAD(P)-dependent oxidoreductase n=1 Tax=Pseudonocardia sp. C8 TaxID=2762759 RepID=UPI001642CA9F|nr:SDR family NAD(P)-dependent oxidoreductase [Pseudonocardia sp. C8]MBC3193742.1 SDR family NAD(P)-dependent oxidoreductase [Pseudonocardia sp. C8]
MVQLAGDAAFVTGGRSRIARGVAGALVAAGARVAIADADESGLAEAADELRRSGGTVTTVRLDAGDAQSWTDAAEAAEDALGRISIVCDLDDEAGSRATGDEPFRVCRWTSGVGTGRRLPAAHTFLPRFRARGVRPHILSTAPVSGLVAMGLLVPGSVATRVRYTVGVAAAGLFGSARSGQAAGAVHAGPAAAAGPTEVGRQIVEALPRDGYLIATQREWTTSTPSTAALLPIPA